MSTALFGARLLEFNLLPSLTLHPSRHAAFGAPLARTGFGHGVPPEL